MTTLPDNGAVMLGGGVLELIRHAADKLQTYGITGSRLHAWRATMDSGIPFLDVSTGARGLLIRWEERPWIVILRDRAA